MQVRLWSKKGPPGIHSLSTQQSYVIGCDGKAMVLMALPRLYFTKLDLDSCVRKAWHSETDSAINMAWSLSFCKGKVLD